MHHKLGVDEIKNIVFEYIRTPLECSILRSIGETFKSLCISAKPVMPAIGDRSYSLKSVNLSNIGKKLPVVRSVNLTSGSLTHLTTAESGKTKFSNGCIEKIHTSE